MTHDIGCLAKLQLVLSASHVWIEVLSRVASIIGSVIGIGRYWDISTLSVIGILIILLTDYASMMS